MCSLIERASISCCSVQSSFRSSRASPLQYTCRHMDCKSHIDLPAASIGPRPDVLDFRRGIRLEELEDNEHVTRILKFALESEYGQPFVTERWGRSGLLAMDGLAAARDLHHGPATSLGSRHGKCRGWNRSVELYALGRILNLFSV